MHQVSEPLRWRLRTGNRLQPAALADRVALGLAGAIDIGWSPPPWLLPHQVMAAQRLAGALRCFGGALLADAVGLGKTFTALAVATRYRRVVVTCPAILIHQWKPLVQTLTVHRQVIVSHESLSRGSSLPVADLVVVDEAHRFRNPNTRRYAALATSIGGADVLLLTATPAVNGAGDLLNLLALFMTEPLLSFMGLPGEQPLARVSPNAIMRSIAPLIVARSYRTADLDPHAIPRAADGRVHASAPAPTQILGDLLDGIDALTFPHFADQRVRRLLRHHALHRLASSTQALSATLRRHRRVIQRLQESGDQTAPRPAQTARAVFDDDDEFQFMLPLGKCAERSVPSAGATLVTELERLDVLLDRLSRIVTSPKERLLRETLASRDGRKTIVFVTAAATAHALSDALGWKRIVVVTGRNARIASGTIPVSDALTLFAPDGTGSPKPHERAVAQTMIATDLVSEGLNLQDADGVVHYDLPWTPLRLQQRVGRTLRLGSPHRTVDVIWFAPHPDIERRCGMRHLVDRKAEVQRSLGVPVQSRTGRAQVVGAALEQREEMLSVARFSASCFDPAYAVAEGPDVSVFVVRWTLAPETFREILCFVGDDATPVDDLDVVSRIAQRLLAGATARTAPPGHHLRAITNHVRARMRTALRQPAGEETRRLRRRVLDRAREVADGRHYGALECYENVLEVLGRGVPVGGSRSLDTLLAGRAPARAFRSWSRRWDRGRLDMPTVLLETALFGDGSRAD